MIHEADTFVFYDEVQYTKNDWRNRNQIYTKNGLQWLSIPVAAKFTNHKISEVVLEPAQWQDKHFKSLYFGYKSAPHFAQLEELITDYLTNRQWTSLKNLNHYMTKKISERIGIQTKFVDSADYVLEEDKVSRLLNVLKQVGATEYISGPSGKNYLEQFHTLFQENGISISYKNYPAYKPYKQLAEPFQNSTSIVDMIAHLSYADIGEHIWGK